MPEKTFKEICEELQECRHSTEPNSIPELFGIQYKEVYITRWLGYLFDPNKNGLGELATMPLNALLSAGECGEISGETDIKDIKVYTEYVLDSKRRIDIFIDTPKYLIGIENKICSDEQKDQTKDYADIIKKMAETNGKKDYCIYLYPEWNDRSEPENRFHRVTYRQLYNKLKENISSTECKDRSQWLLNEFIKYVEENLMAFKPMTETARLYSIYRQDIENASDEYDNYIQLIAENIVKKCKELKPKKLNKRIYQINTTDVPDYFRFHYEIEFRSKIFLFIHLEKNGKSNINFDFVKKYFAEKSGQEIHSTENTCTIFEDSFDMDFQSENDMNNTLDKIIETMNSDEFNKWSNIAEECKKELENK